MPPLDTSALEAAFTAAGVTGRLHARPLDADGPEVSLGADEPVVLASVFKVLLVLEFARQAAAGQLDPAERVRVGREDRLGGLGTAACQDEVDMSWRDLALFALMLSDNTAADVLMRRVGLDNVQALAVELGLSHTRIVGGPRQLLESMFADVGAANEAEFARLFPALPPARLAELAVVDPARTTAATPRDMTQLLALIWRDGAGPAEACAEVRRLLSRQACPHRLSAAFDENVTVAAKSGTVLGIRNEIGVITYPDHRRYAVAVFTTGPAALRRPTVDAAIGQTARQAIELLRP